MRENNCYKPMFRTNEEYLLEINEMLITLENYKVKFIYGIIKGILEEGRRCALLKK